MLKNSKEMICFSKAKLNITNFLYHFTLIFCVTYVVVNNLRHYLIK